ncbi:hypothetical protein ACFMKC_19920, partial [Acinetobacter baumannii]
AGRVVEAGDGCIADTWTFSAGALSIAVNLGDETTNNCVVVTDNERDFQGIEIINPLRTSAI